MDSSAIRQISYDNLIDFYLIERDFILSLRAKQRLYSEHPTIAPTTLLIPSSPLNRNR